MKIYLDNNLGVEKVEQEELTQDTYGYNILKVYIPNAVLTPYDTFTCYYGALLQNGRKVGWFAMEARTSTDADYEENYTLYKATLEQCIVSVDGKVYIGCQILLGNSGNATLIKKNTAVVQFNVRKSVAINNDILVLDPDQTNTDVLESYKNLLENALLTYATKATTYTKTEMDSALSQKADKSDTYTKTEVDVKEANLEAQMASDKLELNNQINTTNGILTATQAEVAKLKSVQNVVEVVATKSALNSYDTTKLDVNDKVQVIADETHDGASTIYNWSGSAWQYVGAYGTNSAPKATAITHTGNQLKDYSGNNIYPVLDTNQVETENIKNGNITYPKLDFLTFNNLFSSNTYGKIDITTILNVQTGKYLNKVNGGLVTFENGAYSDYYPAKNGDVFYYTGKASSSTCGIALYDSSKTFLASALVKDANNNPFIGVDYEYTLNNVNVAYVRFGTSNYIDNPLSISKKTPKGAMQYVNDIYNEFNYLNDWGGYHTSDITNTNLTSGEFVYKTGNFGTAENSARTGYIELDHNATYKVSGRTQYDAALIVTYDSNRNFIRAYCYTADRTQVIWNNYEYTPLSDEIYAVFGALTIQNYTFNVLKVVPYDLKTKVEDIEKELNNGNVLYNKKWYAAGDSLTAGDFTGYVDSNGKSGTNSDAYDKEWGMYKTYPYWIAKRNKIQLTLDAINGSIMALDKTYVSGESENINLRQPFSYERYLNVPADTDYLTLYFGTNDVTNCNLGTIDDATNETFYGAWNVIMNYYFSNMPFMKIGVIIRPSTNDEWRSAMIDICHKWGIPYLDLRGNDLIPFVIGGRINSLNLSTTAYNYRYSAFRVGENNGHPNVKAHEYMSTFIENFLRSL